MPGCDSRGRARRTYVFLLREVFDYEYTEIADMLGLSSADCRQLFHRAKRRLAERKPRFRADVDEMPPLVERFVRAFSEGSEDELKRVLAADVGFWSDGGGKVAAARRPVFGREAVVNMLVGFRRTAPAAGIPLETVRLQVVNVNCASSATRTSSSTSSGSSRQASSSCDRAGVGAVRVVLHSEQ